jgi:hypothetical protein
MTPNTALEATRIRAAIFASKFTGLPHFLVPGASAFVR